MEKSSNPAHHHHNSSKTLLSSCLLAAFSLLLLSLTLTLTLFLLFRPRIPSIQISSISLPSFSSLNSSSSLRFRFAQSASVRNPNRASFSHYDSSLRLLRGPDQLGFMYIPAGEIAAGQTVYMSAVFPANLFAGNAAGVVEVESRMTVKGRVRVLGYFVHRVEAVAVCRVGFSAVDGSVIGYRC